MSSQTAILFPGQGAYLPGVLAGRLECFPAAAEAVEAVDAIAAEHGHEPVSPLLTDADAPTLDELLVRDPERLDLAIYATNAAAYEILDSLGVRAQVLTGHSFGELAALSAAGVATVADVARLVCLRISAFRQAEPDEGGMVALAAPAWRASHLIGLLDEPDLCVCIDNGPAQSVISGPVDPLKKAQNLAEEIGLKATRLRAAYAFHNPLLHRAADLFSRATADLELRHPRLPVYSAILGRHIQRPADARELIERNMVAPIGFYDALLTLFRSGIRIFVEAGARQALTGIVQSSLPASAVAVPLLPSRGGPDKLVASLTAAGISAAWQLPATADINPLLEPVPAATPKADTTALPSAAPRMDAGHQPETAPESGLPGHPDLVAELAEIYAEHLGFPADMLTPDLDLEADLGVDSVKQLTIFSKLLERYRLPEPSGELRTRATTLGAVAALLRTLRP